MLVPKITSSVNKDFLISCTKIVVTKTQLGFGQCVCVCVCVCVSVCVKCIQSGDSRCYKC